MAAPSKNVVISENAGGETALPDDSAELLDDMLLSEVHVGAVPSTLQVVDTGRTHRTVFAIRQSKVSRHVKWKQLHCNASGSSSSTTGGGAAEGDSDDDVAAASNTTRGDSSDSDVEPPRKRQRQSDSTSSDHTWPFPPQLAIYHALATPLKDVGQQIWRGALLLGDFILSYPDLITNQVVLELGAGVGFVGLIAACVAKLVFITDGHVPSLHMARDNAIVNGLAASDIDAASATSSSSVETVVVRELPWGCPATALPKDTTNDLAWSNDEVVDLQSQVSVVLASDVVYDDAATVALFQTLRWLLRPGVRFFMSTERRVNFDATVLAPVVTGYAQFMHHVCTRAVHWSSTACLQGHDPCPAQAKLNASPPTVVTSRDCIRGAPVNGGGAGGGAGAGAGAGAGSGATQAAAALEPAPAPAPASLKCSCGKRFAARRLATDVQHVGEHLEYERVTELELWELKCLSTAA